MFGNKGLILLSLVLLGLVLFLVVRNIDSAVTIDHLSSQVAHDRSAKIQMAKCLTVLVRGKSPEEVRSLFKNLSDPDTYKDRADEIELGGLSFKFERNQCVEVGAIKF